MDKKVGTRKEGEKREKIRRGERDLKKKRTSMLGLCETI
jgi:hypothetical protein